MADAKPRKPAHASAADTTAAVDAFMKSLDHPFKAEIEVIRKTITGAAPGIHEGIKWNAPSFRTTEYFATTNLREKAGIGLILHLGAKVRALPAGGVAIKDPANMLKWLGKDRAMIVFRDGKDLAGKRAHSRRSSRTGSSTSSELSICDNKPLQSIDGAGNLRAPRNGRRRPELSKDLDEGFYERADEHLRIASDQLDAVSQGRVSASLMYACARFNVWVSASHRETPADVKRAYGQTIEYFVAEYRKMLVKNLDDYVDNFDKFQDSSKPD